MMGNYMTFTVTQNWIMPRSEPIDTTFVNSDLILFMEELILKMTKVFPVQGTRLPLNM